ncbi:MAG: 5'/3'-nucleotidase SurE [Paludibacteraceae bacterium]|nr:5'/3'-nucleotidase SurE [Paludibacteraceae bacterium]
MKDKLILITNDDGVNAKGISELVGIARKYGKVVVVAPDGARSGQSNAITMTEPLYKTKLLEEDGLTIYKCSGTPTDCVKMALNNILDKKPDFIFSGINHGSNSSVNVIYSGTMGAVLEGCSQGITSVGFSLCDHSKDADFSLFLPFVESIIAKVSTQDLPQGVCLNVNAPIGEIKGVRVCMQSKGQWIEEFDKRVNPNGQIYYWMTGVFENAEPENTGTDEWALNNGFVSVVPTTCDLTHYESLAWLKKIGYEQVE